MSDAERRAALRLPAEQPKSLEVNDFGDPLGSDFGEDLVQRAQARVKRRSRELEEANVAASQSLPLPALGWTLVTLWSSTKRPRLGLS